ncbi:ferredoxin family protein [Rhodococcus sp. WY5]|uniref:4Fe-4S dicluster domain-containing protein n=1 Tax=Rhodococcus sp. WY5 TaxID=2708349 RepID=UPI0035B4407D
MDRRPSPRTPDTIEKQLDSQESIECIDCGACEPVCPVEAISYESDVPARWEDFIDDNARFFHRPLPGASEMVGSPGGSMNLGRVGVDTELVGGYPHSNRPDIGPPSPAQ